MHTKNGCFTPGTPEVRLLVWRKRAMSLIRRNCWGGSRKRKTGKGRKSRDWKGAANQGLSESSSQTLWVALRLDSSCRCFARPCWISDKPRCLCWHARRTEGCLEINALLEIDSRCRV